MRYCKNFSILVLWVILFLVGCATPTTKRVEIKDALVELEAKKQREIALKTSIDNQSRLDRVSFPILASAVSFCGKRIRPFVGIHFANKHTFPKNFQDAAVSLYGLGESLQIIYVIPGSPAETAGFRQGDVLVSLNGETIPVGKNADKEIRQLLKKHLKSEQSALITVVRDGIEKAIDIEPVNACDYSVMFGEEDDVNAFADGNNVVILKGMLRFAQDDQELALVISHELAHNAMKHIDAKDLNYAIGSIFDIAAAAFGVNTQGAFGNLASRVYSQEFEAEADYVGLYMMARAGLKIDNAANFWRRMAAEYPGNITRNHAASHPATSERFVAIEKTVEEIHKKQETGLPLTPEYKKPKKVN